MDDYWDAHYRNGGASGAVEDYRRTAERKRAIIQRYITLGKDSVLDLGCGDLRFWDNIPLDDWYLGVDISQTVIERNREKYPDARFDTRPIADNRWRADAVVCFDVLYHIMDDDEYQRTINNITESAKRYAFVGTWVFNPLNGILPRLMRLKATGHLEQGVNTTDGYHQTYRRFEDSIPTVFKDFELVCCEYGVYVLRRIQ